MKALAPLAVWLVDVVAGGLVLTKLWVWFVVPLGPPPIGVAHALGIAVLVGLLTHQIRREDWEGERGAVFLETDRYEPHPLRGGHRVRRSVSGVDVGEAA